MRLRKITRGFINTDDDFFCAIAINVRDHQLPGLPARVDTLPQQFRPVPDAERRLFFSIERDYFAPTVSIKVELENDCRGLCMDEGRAQDYCNEDGDGQNQTLHKQELLQGRASTED